MNFSSCGSTLNGSERFCHTCGTAVTTSPVATPAASIQVSTETNPGTLSAIRTCAGCGNGLGTDQELCPMCGRNNPRQVAPSVNHNLTLNVPNLDLTQVGAKIQGTLPAGQLAKLPTASSGDRFVAQLIDSFIIFILSFTTVGGLIYWLWMGYAKGSGGQSVGYRAMNLYLASDRDGQPIGGGAGIGRELLHFLDALPVGLGYIIGLSTGKTFADRIMHTKVVSRK